MAIKKDDAKLAADSEKLVDKKGEDLIRPPRELKERKQQKNYEAGIDPQDEQLNTVPEGIGAQQGDSKPGGGNRLHKDTLSKRRQSQKK